MRLIIFLIILGFVFWYFSNKKKKGHYKTHKSSITELVLDENCQTYIRKDKAIKLNIGNKTYYFCSEKCLREYLEKIKQSQS